MDGAELERKESKIFLKSDGRRGSASADGTWMVLNLSGGGWENKKERKKTKQKKKKKKNKYIFKK